MEYLRRILLCSGYLKVYGIARNMWETHEKLLYVTACKKCQNRQHMISRPHHNEKLLHEECCFTGVYSFLLSSFSQNILQDVEMLHCIRQP